MLCHFLLNAIISSSQSTGDIAFIGFNTDSDKDFSIVALADISANTTIYITDDETTGIGSPSALFGSEGTITWSTGGNDIKAGTVVVFTDIDNNANIRFGSSIGSIIRSGAFNISGSRDGLIAFVGANSNSPTVFLAALQIGNDNTFLGPFDGDGITLTNTGLVIGTSIIVFDDSSAPDGASYIASRSSETSYSDYYSLLSDDSSSNWTNIVNGDGETLLPFSQEAFTTSSTIWNGTSDDWNTAGNWNNGVPTIHSNVSIPNTSNNPKIKSGTIALAGNITIDPGASLEVTQNLTSKGLTTINSSSSNSGTFKVTGTYTGSLVYNRNIPHAFNSWYLISSPVQNYRVVDFATQNPIQLGSGTGTSQNIALAKYDNGQALANDRWSYYTVGDIDHATAIADTTDELTTGQGFSSSLSTADDITFEGTLQTADVTRTISIGASGVGTNFNLIGNPYPAYLDSNTFMTNNSNITETIWVWNQSLPDYQTKNLASDFQIAPGQGFFIEANSGASVLFETSTLSHEITNTFQKSANPYIKFTISSEGIKRYAEVYYLNNSTKGFDNGYDSKLFGGVSHPFALYTHLISDSKGEKFQIQSLPNSDYENMVIPVGVNAATGKEITFTTEILNLPTDINVFLEDRLTNIFTRLDETNSEYKVTLTETLNGVGRFYIHTAESVLSAEDVLLNSVGIFKTDASTLKITGLPQGKTSFYLYNILGKEMMTTLFTSNGNKEISLSKLASGIYLAKMQTKKGAISKKIILE